MNVIMIVVVDDVEVEVMNVTIVDDVEVEVEKKTVEEEEEVEVEREIMEEEEEELHLHPLDLKHLNSLVYIQVKYEVFKILVLSCL